MLLNLPSAVSVYVCLEPTDMRCSFDKLASLVQSIICQNPLSGHLFVFVSKRRNMIKILFWDRTGDLHREKIVLDVPESEKTCSCCGNEKKHIGDDVTEELEYKPAVFFVNQYIKPKYACPNCPEQKITMVSMPPRPIEIGVAGKGLLSYILVSKYVDHLPLYRLQQLFMRYTIDINRQKGVHQATQGR